MAVVTVPSENRTIRMDDEIRNFLQSYGIWYQRWDEPHMPESETSQQVLERYAERIAELKELGGYATADVIDVNPATPGLDEMLTRFSREHIHNEDEVRLVVRGRGVFHIHPVDKPVFAVQMGPGDAISVPAGTKHWFNLCAERRIQTIRLFQDTSGWTPHYTGSDEQANYQPLCLGFADAPKSELESPLKP